MHGHAEVAKQGRPRIDETFVYRPARDVDAVGEAVGINVTGEHYEGEEFDNRSCAGVRFSGVDNVGKRQNEICEFRAPSPELKVLIEASCGDGGAQGIASQNITRYAAEPKREVSKRHPKPAHRQVELQALAPSRLVER